SVNFTNFFMWGSFDGSTNTPIIYPDSASIAALESQVFFQILGGLLPNGSISGNNAGNSYSVQLQAQGAAPPFNWAMAPDSPGLPVGLSLSASGFISGVLTGATVGTYDFTVQATDSTGRTAQSQLFIEVDP
ncbi:MAG TPA: Ig domain-containing protein, partial [Verrucomicrobiae bacterium]|nr:Ig domain-containing protein [Verrucomicrobiae bacterium]